MYVSNSCRVFAGTQGDIYANWRFYTASGIGPLRAPQPPEGVDGGPYQIRNELTKQCLTVSYSQYVVGNHPRVFPCTRIPSRLWIARVFDA